MKTGASARLAVTQFPTAALKLDPRNPRQHSGRQIKQISRSIQKFGFIVPVLIDQHLRVIAGHGRVAAAALAGLSEIPAIRIDHLTEAQLRAFAIAENKLTENAGWNDRLLGEIFTELSNEVDLDLEITGFSTAEIDLFVEGLAPSNSIADAADELPSSQQQLVSKIGDLWKLGDHRVLCGNALDNRAYVSLLEGAKAAMVFTDPPYNVPIDGNVSGLGAVRHREFAMASGEMTATEFIGFLMVVTKWLAQHSVDGSMHFVCMDWRHVSDLITAGAANYADLKNICVWVKSNAGMGSFYRSQHELVCVFKSGRSRHRNNIELGRHGRHRSNVWNYAGANSFGRGTDEGHLLALHPTVKPVRLIADAMLDCTARRDLVLDPFLGSGSTVIAAERTGRRCYGLEIDPAYVDTIVRRWQAYTGQAAYHAVTDRAFDDVAAERCHVG